MKGFIYVASVSLLLLSISLIPQISSAQSELPEVLCWLPVESEEIPGRLQFRPGEGLTRVNDEISCKLMGGVISAGIGKISPSPYSKFSMPLAKLDTFEPQPLADANFFDSLDGLIKDIGIWEKEYEKDKYICKDFALDLYNELEKRGYDATITFIWCDTDGDGAVGGNNDAEGHAVTDLHLKDGSVLWIEPQAAPPDNIVTMDKSNPPDGKVNYLDGGKVGNKLFQKSWSNQMNTSNVSPKPTEGNCLYLVFT